MRSSTSLLLIALTGFVFACEPPLEEADAITVSLDVADGKTPFGHMLGFSMPQDSTGTGFWDLADEDVTGIPDSLQDVALFSEHIQTQQLAYQMYLVGEIDSVEYASWMGRPSYDSTLVTPELVDQQISFALARTAHGRQVALFDTDNDEDFSDENVFVLPEDDPERAWGETVELLPEVAVTFEYYNGEDVVTVSTPVLLNPFVHLEAFKDGVIFGGLSYHTGTLSYAGQDYAWWAANIMNPGWFKDDFTRVWFEPFDRETASFPVRPEAQIQQRQLEMQDSTKSALPEGYFPPLPEPYEIGDEITMGEDTFRLAGINVSGTNLMLKRVGGDNVGLRTGMIAPAFEGPTLDSTTVRLADYRGKYVLIDFWGTWCGPCLGEIPFLLEAYEAYPRSTFDILAVANDEVEALRTFVEEEGLPWAQIVQQEKSASTREILRSYRITGYPTTFLLDPDGVIIAREGELRGEFLGKTLAKFLGAADG